MSALLWADAEGEGGKEAQGDGGEEALVLVLVCLRLRLSAQVCCMSACDQSWSLMKYEGRD
jgi:hypothetical protein